VVGRTGARAAKWGVPTVARSFCVLRDLACRSRSVSANPRLQPLDFFVRDARFLGAWPFISEAVGVGHEVQPVSLVRCPDARSRKYRRPDGVLRTLQVSRSLVEPPEPNRRRNLLPKDRWRFALLDEAEEFRPQVPRVVEAHPLSEAAEGLTGTAAGGVFQPLPETFYVHSTIIAAIPKIRQITFDARNVTSSCW
jgi:hypothetical protein